MTARALTPNAPIVFLHIPKTAGQTVHAELSRIAGKNAVSPVRVHTQVKTDPEQLPPGYSVYSGHIDWTALQSLPGNRFTFSVLRDPRERIASFYFYLLKEARAQSAEELEKPHRAGMKRILSVSAEEYFFDGPRPWQVFIHDHYDNFYTRYFATRQMRSWNQIKDSAPEALLKSARANIVRDVDKLYSTLDLGALERDIAERYEAEISVTNRFVNTGDQPRNEPRWPKLIALMESEEARARLTAFTEQDDALLKALGIPV